MAEKNGNGNLLKVAIGVVAFVGGLGVAWGCQQSAVAQTTKEIAVLKVAAQGDHDTIIAMNEQLVAIRESVARIEKAISQH